ncbi:MAG: hypothetical protein FWG37_01200 [Clostridia bacterium]|nr:hypothetical protein [Clostridia bacterium]
MDNEIARVSDPVERRAGKTRANAGKALAIFTVLMIALTWASRMLEAMTIATVSVTAIQRGSLEKQVRQSGVLMAAETSPVLAEETARVLELFAKTGAEVEKGDALFRLDYSDVVKTKYDALQAARQNAEKKQRTLDWAAADLGNSAVNRILQRMGSVAELEAALGAAELALDSGGNEDAVNRLAQVKSAYETEKRFLDGDMQARDYRTKLDDAQQAAEDRDLLEAEYAALMRGLDTDPSGAEYTKTFVAPVSGVVLESSLMKGSMATPNNPAMTLSERDSGLSLTVTVSEDEAGDMAIGDTVRIVIAGDRYESAIESIVLVKDRQGMADVSFRLSDNGCAPGMAAEMIYTMRTQNFDIVIPRSALRHDSDGDFVFVVTQQEGALGARRSVRRVNVYVLDQDSGRAAVQGGLTQRDVVVERSDRSLSDGDRVRLEEN